MIEGIIFKALSGFYYVDTGDAQIECRARGLFRKEGITPLVGDKVTVTDAGNGKGYLHEILPRKNSFIRPAVANIDQLIVIASEAIPVSDPFLIDRIIAIATLKHCTAVLCINKSDVEDTNSLFEIYSGIGVTTIKTSAVTGEGIAELKTAIAGKINAFTGNSGVGKSSILNALEPDFHLLTGEVSDKLGRGRHTTRHVELFKLSCNAVVADTPGFSAFDVDERELATRDNIRLAFKEFEQYEGKCRFSDCAHVKEAGCAVLHAVADGKIFPSRHASYIRLYEQASRLHSWNMKTE